jgi:hypothetical protein
VHVPLLPPSAAAPFAALTLCVTVSSDALYAGPSLSSGGGGGFGPSSSSSIGAAAAGTGSKAGLPRKGMQLGKSKGASSMLENLAKEEGVTVATLDEPSRPTAAGPTGTHVISGVW